MRGEAPSEILCYLEEVLGKNLHEVVDVVTGTSTGSIVSCLLASGYSAKDIISFYEGKDAKTIFKHSLIGCLQFFSGINCPKFDSNNLKNILKDKLEDKKLKDCLTHLLVPVDDWANRTGKIFTTIIDKEESIEDIELWKVCTSSSSAETYFSGFNRDNKAFYFDGGLYSGNPSDMAFLYTQKHLGATVDNTIVISLGTGTLVDYIAPEKLEKFGWVDFAGNLINEIMDRNTTKSHDIMNMLFEGTGNYFRFQFDCPKEYEAMDNTSDKFIQGLKKFTRNNIDTIWKESLSVLVEKLKNNK